MAASQSETQPLNRPGSDPYTVPWTSLLDVKKATLDLRRDFVRNVYGILAMQLLLTTLIAAPFQLVDTAWLASNAWLVWLSMVMTIAIICAMSCSPDLARTFPANEILLFLFTAFQGVLVGYVSAAYSWQSLALAVGTTTVLVFGLSAYAFTTRSDFTGTGVYLFVALLTLCTFGLILLVLALCGIHIQWMMITYDVICVLLFMMFIVYDTQLMLGDWGGHEQQFSVDDYVFAALSLYLDIVNLFLHLLRLLGDSPD
mmetsp:Transcript_91908/g.297407  ORF Transcript_91908/g.297407 Transcript_91908/m.297407 type:complete len:257 (-) Transcript_91908:68-838(-)